MPFIKINISSRGEVSTWVDDDDWDSLTAAQRHRLIRDYVRKWYPHPDGLTHTQGHTWSLM